MADALAYMVDADMADALAYMIDAYIAQLSPMEKKVLEIATTHLETSFSLVKSIGFLEWQQAQAQAQAQALPNIPSCKSIQHPF